MIARQLPNNVSRRLRRHIKHCRESLGMSREKLACVADLSPDTIGRLERGDYPPRLTTVVKIATGLGLTLSSLFSAIETRNHCRCLEIAHALDDCLSLEEQDLLLSFLHVFKQRFIDAS